MRRFRRCSKLAIDEMELVVWVARGFLARSRGLTGLDRLPDTFGLLIPRCGSIHTLGMRFPIDVVFVSWPADSEHRVVVGSVVRRVRPGRFVHAGCGARATVEVPADAAGRLAPGDALTLRPVDPRT